MSDASRDSIDGDDLTNEQWEQVRDLLPGQNGRGRPWRNHRQVLDGILWVLRNRSSHTRASWRSMPERYGPWETAYTRWLRWRNDGLWSQICQRLGYEELA